MKRFLIVFVSFLGLYLTAQKPEEVIRDIMSQQATAWSNGDVDGFMEHYWKSEELTFVSKNGVSKGWQKVYDNYKKNYPDKETMGTLVFDKLEFDKLSGKAYLVTGSWFLKRKDEVGGWFSLIFRKIQGKWRIVYDHTS